MSSETRFEAALENTTNLPGVYATYSWSATNRNGFPNESLVMNRANTFKEGAYELAPTETR